jgi:hypothetical protein
VNKSHQFLAPRSAVQATYDYRQVRAFQPISRPLLKDFLLGESGHGGVAGDYGGFVGKQVQR